MTCNYIYNGNKYSLDEITTKIENGEISYQKITDSSTQWLVDNLNLTKDDIRVVTGLIDNKSFGRFLDDGRILLSDMAIEGTEYHEGFHRVFQGYLTSTERQNLIKEFKKNKNYKAKLEYLKENYKGKSEEKLIEEHFANEFRNFMLNDGDYNSPLSSVFDRILNFLKKLFGYESEINKLYNSIKSGKFSKSTLISDNKLETADSVLIGNLKVSYPELNAITDSIMQNLIESVIRNNTLDDLISKKINVLEPFTAAIAETKKSILNSVKEKYPEETAKRKQLKDAGVDQIEIIKQIPNLIAATKRVNDLFKDLDNKDSIIISELTAKLKANKISLFLQEPTIEPEEVNTSDEAVLQEEDNIDSEAELVYDGQGVGSRYDKASFEFDPNSGMSAQLKLLFSSIKTKEKNEYGVYSSIDFIRFADYLNMHLAGIPSTWDDISDRLVELSTGKYGHEIEQLLELLDYTNVDNPASNRLKIQFVGKFSQTRLNFVTTFFTDAGFFLQETEKTQALESTRREMNNSLSEAIKLEDSIETWFDKLKATSTDDITNVLRLLGLSDYITIGTPAYEALSPEEKSLQRQLAENAKTIKNVMSRASIEDIKIHIYSAYTATANKKLDINGAVTKIAKSNLTENLELSVFNAEGNKVYTITLNTYTSQIINQLNFYADKYRKLGFSGKELRTRVLKELPHLDTAYTQNSVWLDRIFNDGVKLEMYVNDGVVSQKDNSQDSKKTTSDLAETDLITQFVTQMLNQNYNPIYQAVKHSDRSTFLSYSIGSKLMVEAGNLEQAIEYAIPYFKGYILDEVNRIKLIKKGVANDIQHFSNSKSAIFGQRKSSTGELVPVLEGFDELVSSSNFDATWESGGFEQKMKDTLFDEIVLTRNFMNDWGYGRNDIGIHGLLKHKDLDNIAALFTINSIMGHIEETKLLIGDLKLYKDSVDSFKRFNVWSGTGQLSVVGSIFVNTVNHYERDQTFYLDGVAYDYSQLTNSSNPELISEIVGAEQDYSPTEEYIGHLRNNIEKSLASFYRNFGITDSELKAAIKAESTSESYRKINEPDGQSYVNMFEMRRLMIGWQKWTDDLQDAFNQELAILNGEEHNYKVTYSITDINRKRQRSKNRIYKSGDGYLTQIAENDNDTWVETTIENTDRNILEQEIDAHYDNLLATLNTSNNLMESFFTAKPQYAGTFISDQNYWDNPSEERLSIMGVAKTSYYPLLPSQTRNTNLDKLHKNLLKNGIGVYHFGSARKFGARINPDKLTDPNHTKGFPNFYDITGDVHESFEIEKHVQWMERRYMKNQVEISSHEKTETIQSTQANKLNLSNLFQGGYPIDVDKSKHPSWENYSETQKKSLSDFYRLASEYINIQNERISLAITKLTEELSFNRNTSEYASYSEIIDTVKRAAIDRNSPVNIIEAIDKFNNLQDKIIDFLPGANKIEPILMSLVSNNVINMYRNGTAIPQVSVLGWEKGLRKVNEKGTVYASDELSSYIDKDGNITEAEIIAPLPISMLQPLSKIYGTMDILEIVDRVNADLAKGNYEHFDPELFIIKGLRIPNQATGSNDVFKIKRFLVPSNVSRVIV